MVSKYIISFFLFFSMTYEEVVLAQVEKNR